MKLFLNDDMSEVLEEKKAKQRVKRHSKSIGDPITAIVGKTEAKTGRTTNSRRRRRSKTRTKIRARK
jgi:HSP90 family molecular chaperone